MKDVDAVLLRARQPSLYREINILQQIAPGVGYPPQGFGLSWIRGQRVTVQPGPPPAGRHNAARKKDGAASHIKDITRRDLTRRYGDVLLIVL